MRAFVSRLVLVLGFPLVLGGAPALSGCDSGPGIICEANTDQFAFEDVTPEGTERGDTITVGSCVAVEYVGTLAEGGEVFDEGGFDFYYVSNSGLISGFILGMQNQRVGETRRVTVPPTLGYGETALEGRGDNAGIPSCSTLMFDITLTQIYADPRRCG